MEQARSFVGSNNKHFNTDDIRVRLTDLYPDWTFILYLGNETTVFLNDTDAARMIEAFGEATLELTRKRADAAAADDSAARPETEGSPNESEYADDNPGGTSVSAAAPDDSAGHSIRVGDDDAA